MFGLWVEVIIMFNVANLINCVCLHKLAGVLSQNNHDYETNNHLLRFCFFQNAIFSSLHGGIDSQQ